MGLQSQGTCWGLRSSILSCTYIFNICVYIMLMLQPFTYAQAPPCSSDLFQCHQQVPGPRCIPRRLVCDGERDCSDGSDEPTSCSPVTCDAGKFRCRDGTECISVGWLCDNEPDCPDQSDEDPKHCFGSGEDVPEACRPNQYLCDGTSVCIEYTQLCDGVPNCADGEDEGSHCRSRHCDQKLCPPNSKSCTPTRLGAVCLCGAKAYHNETDNTCSNLNECLYDGFCDQQCENSGSQGYTCTCIDGYTTGSSQKSCHAINDPPGEPAWLAYGEGENSINIIKLLRQNNTEKYKNVSVTRLKSFDYNFSNHSLCYLSEDTTQEVVFRCAAFDNLSLFWEVPISFNLTAVTQIAYDWVSDNWYFVDVVREKIFVCTPSSGVCVTVIHTNIQVPKAIALDPVKGYIFFSNRLNMPKIERASLNGSSRQVIVSQRQIVVPATLTLDYANEHVYWADAYQDRVERVKYDGTERKTILKKTWVQNIASLSILENDLYIAKHTQSAIEKIHRLDGLDRTALVNVQESSQVTIIHRARQPLVTYEPDRSCSDIAVVTYDASGQYTTNCLCKAGYKLDSDASSCTSALEPMFLLYSNAQLGQVRGLSLTPNSTDDVIPPVDNLQYPVAMDFDSFSTYVYYSDTKRNVIGRQKLDGSDRDENFISEGIYKCEGIAIDWMASNILWTDEQAKTINVARLSNVTFRKILISEDLSHPRAIVVDPRPTKGHMYWTDWTQGRTLSSARIERANLDGTNRALMYHKNLQWPNGLSLDLAANVLYWCDAYTDRIESLDLINMTHTVLVTYDNFHGHPYGLVHHATTDNIYFYWTEFKAGQIRVYDKTTKKTSVLRTDSVPLYEIRMYDANVQRGGNPCKNLPDNGGCEHLCLMTSNNMTCLCADNYKIQPDGTCQFDQSTAVSSSCSPHEFRCANQLCVNTGWLCDGDNDCGDGSDEDNSTRMVDGRQGPCYNFTCPNKNMFQCADNHCIFVRWRCDGEMDCRGGEDEDPTMCDNVPCPDNMTQCVGTSRCIHKTWVCDYDDDCLNGSDEVNCNYTACEPGQFTCKNKRCISKQYVCDGDNDCRDNSDESMCLPVNCDLAVQFQCKKSGKCVDREAVCNGAKDCSDNSDEIDCAVGVPNITCNSDEYRCTEDGRCIPQSWICDGQPDCPHGDDEEFCVLDCPHPSLLCNVTRQNFCVDASQLCDGQRDCPDGSDETELCAVEVCRRLGRPCSHTCQNIPIEPGFACICPQDKVINRVTGRCEDPHPCKTWGICSQKCEEIGPRHKCVCNADYKLAADHFTCEAIGQPDEYLLFSKRYEILRVHPKTQTLTSLVSGLINTIALDYFYNHTTKTGDHSFVFWTDVADDKIYRGTLIRSTLTNISVVIDYSLTTSTTEGIAVDWVTQHIYWVDSSSDHIEVSDFYGGERRTVISTDIAKPRAIAVDPNVGKMFWSDWESHSARIEMSAMSGDRNQRRILKNVSAIPNGRWPNGLTLDYVDRRVYWVDAGAHAIFTITYDGNDFREILKGSGYLVHPFAITQFEDRIYWTDWGTNSLVSAKKWNGTALKVVQKVIRSPFDLTLFHPNRQQIRGGNPCSAENNNGGCDPSAICLLSFNETGRTTSCICPYLSVKHSDGVSCIKVDTFLLHAKPESVKGVNMPSVTQDGDNLAPRFNIIAPWSGNYVLNPLALDFDSSTDSIYWSGLHVAKSQTQLGQPRFGIMSAKLDHSDLTVLVDTGSDVVSGLAIDWVSGNMYFSTYTKDSWSISVSQLSGAYRTVLIQEGVNGIGVQQPNSLAVDPDKGKLYWTSGTGGIFYSQLDGSDIERFVEVNVASRPSNLTVDDVNQRLYWINEKTIWYQPLDQSAPPTLFNTSLTDINAMTIDMGRVLYFSQLDSAVFQASSDGIIEQKVMEADIVTILKTYQDRKVLSETNGCADNNGGCTQLCLPRGPTNITCLCTLGYDLSPDGKTCQTLSGFLLYSSGTKIQGNTITRDNPANTLSPIAQISDATSIDFYARDEFIYWVDSRRKMINRIKHDLTKRETVVANTILGVESIAVDWVAGNLYWSDLGHDVIEVARLTGSHRRVLLHDDLDKPSNLAVDPINGYLYWTDSGKYPRIERSRLDGSNREIVTNISVSSPTALALDSDFSSLFWCNKRPPSMNRYDFRTKKFEKLSTDGCEGLTLHADKLYFSSTTYRGSVVVANKNNISDFYKVTLENSTVVFKDIAYYYQRPASPDNDCSDDRNVCGELCFYIGSKTSKCECAYGRVGPNKTCEPYETYLAYSKVNGIEAVSMSPEENPSPPRRPISLPGAMKNVIGLAVDYANEQYFFSDIQMGKIQSVDFNGTAVTPIADNIGSVEGLAYEPAYHELYWTSFSDSSISRKSLRRHGGQRDVEKIIQLQPSDHPRALVIDSCSSRIFWTNWNTASASIQSAYLSGWNVRSIVTENITTPNGLAIDHMAQKLYWIDARLDKIERIEYDGSNRQLVLQDQLHHGFGLTVYGDFIYWTDWVRRAVLRANKHTGEDITALVKNLPRQPMGIVAVAEDASNCLNHGCQNDNGGCSDICRLDSTGAVYCACLDNKVLQADNITCQTKSTTVDCASDHYLCADGTKCITYDLTCNNITDCPDNSDEKSAFCDTRVCPDGYFHCWYNRRCVLSNKTCDGVNDCGDNSDEADVCGCQNNEFMCQEDKSCIVLQYHCDGDKDCPMGTDEKSCTEFPDCSHLTFGDQSAADEWIKCNETTACILESWICDGINDCYDNSDEQNCPNNQTGVACIEGQFACNDPSRLCIPELWVCDGDKDCQSGADEKNCSLPACPDGFLCDLNEGLYQCLPKDWKCDGRVDCIDRSDETDCGSRTCDKDEFRCLSGNCIPQLWVCDGEEDCGEGSDEHPDSGCSPVCTENDFRCSSNECIPQAFYCDGSRDCRDNSDEPPWCAYLPCEPNEVKCKHSAQCIPKKRLCDGFPDCTDHSDEEECATESPCGENRYQCHNGSCIDKSRVCNGVDDCGQWSDESQCAINECEIPGICKQNTICNDLPIGYSCDCKPGYRRENKQALCEDINECEEFYPCSHYCYNTDGGYKCRCAQGFTLYNKTSCKATSDISPSLLVSNRYYIRQVSDAGTRVDLLVMNLQNAVALDFDIREQKIYWSDVTSTGSNISRMNISNPDSKEVLHNTTLRNPDGLAVDWLGRNLYWCDKTTDTIEVSKLTGAYRKVLIRTGLQEPRGLAVHPFRGWLFYTDWGDNAHIGRLGMDGTARTQLITNHLGWPNSLTVDYITDHIFWADARLDYIGMSDLSGQNTRVIIRDHLPHIFAITTFEDYIYWTDWELKSISRAHKFTGADRRNLTSLIHRPMDIQVFHPLRQPMSVKVNYVNPCENDGGCREGTLCLIRPGGSSRSCACPERHYLSGDKRSCIANCTSSEFLCQNMYKCIPFWWVCDNQTDCGDWSDEANCTKTYQCHQPGLFQCANAESPHDCISPTQICDGIYQCTDGSDEQNCAAHTCLDSQFKCQDQPKCIPMSKRCDNTYDCDDMTDEKNCPIIKCADNEFHCNNKRCVPLMWRCDNDNDCGDNSDEPSDCRNSTCPVGYILCKSTGRCVPKTWECDGDRDCGPQDDSDEPDAKCKNTTCEHTYFRCNNSRCIPGRWQCDYDDDCGDNSDETSCEARKCSESEFKCHNGRCLLDIFRCDGHNHCSDNSDEKDCTIQCKADEFQCKALYCIPRRWLCDGDLDCTDGDDEYNCTAGSNQTLCQPNHYRCRDGQCISPNWLCDGQQDCFAGEDEEIGMCRNMSCTPGHLKCANGKRCVRYDQYCDGIHHCSDGSDELNCGQRQCAVNEMRCKDANICVKVDHICDGYKDCPDGSDEDDFSVCSPVECSTDDNCSNITNSRCISERCTCNPGYQIYDVYSTYQCIEINECLTFGTCDQVCINRKDGYKCGCVSNYSKEMNSASPKMSCKVDGYQAYIVLGVENKIIQSPVSIHGELTTLYPPLHDQEIPTDFRIDSTDVSIEAEMMFITNSHAGKIYWFPIIIQKNMTGTRRPVRSINNLGIKAAYPREIKIHGADIRKPKGIAYDWVSQRLYWADSEKGTIESVVRNGTNWIKHKVIIQKNLKDPHAVAVDPFTNKLFWTVLGDNARVESSFLDGSGRRTITNDMISWPGGIAVDVPNSRVYWTDLKKGTIDSVETAKSYNTEPQTVWQFTQEDVPEKIEVFEDYLYVTMYRSHDVVRLYKFGNHSNPTNKAAAHYPANEHTYIVRGMERLGGVRVVQEHKQTPFPERDACSDSKKNWCGEDMICFNQYGMATCQCAEGFIKKKTSAPGIMRRRQMECEPEPRLNCSSNYCMNGGSCLSDNGAKCHCPPQYEGDRCQHDRCHQLCVNGGSCYMSDDMPACGCRPFFTGLRCEAHICLTFCKNGGKCIKSETELQCSCPPKFIGDQCEIPRNDVCDDYCYNDGICTMDEHDRPVCTCRASYTGDRCEICLVAVAGNSTSPIKLECNDDTVHNAHCTTAQNISMCICPIAFQNKATCHDEHQDSGCHPHCESKCKDYCNNGGQCQFDTVAGSPKCSCIGKWAGARCTYSICQEKCYVNGIENCEVAADRSVTCIYKTGYTGTNCSFSQRCDQNICENGGTCLKSESGADTCQCPVGYRGHLCHMPVTRCTDGVCKNGGSCMFVGENLQCLCADGYVGDDCSKLMPGACSNFCQNQGVCSNCVLSESPYCAQCRCGINYTGSACEQLRSNNQSFPTAAIVVPIILCLALILVVALIIVYKKRYMILAQFRHKRMTEGNEIHNPMYAGNDYEETEDFYSERPTNFSNPMYEQFYNENSEETLVTPESEKNKLLKVGQVKGQPLTSEEADPLRSSFT